MKDLHCRDAGMDCDFVARGNTKEEILDQASTHAKDVHGMKMTPEISRKMESLIHEENSEAHRRSVGQRM